MKTCFLLLTYPQILVTWENVDYNHGSFFDGTYFTVPANGLYCFNALCWQQSSDEGWLSLYINGDQHVWVVRRDANSELGFVNIDTTLELMKNDKVDVRFLGQLDNMSDQTTTYFEGRLIARTNE